MNSYLFRIEWRTQEGRRKLAESWAWRAHRCGSFGVRLGPLAVGFVWTLTERH